MRRVPPGRTGFMSSTTSTVGFKSSVVYVKTWLLRAWVILDYSLMPYVFHPIIVSVRISAISKQRTESKTLPQSISLESYNTKNTEELYAESINLVAKIRNKICEIEQKMASVCEWIL